jgi:hypothetical protein
VQPYNWGRLDFRGKCIRPESEWIPMAVERIVDDEIELATLALENPLPSAQH